MSRTFKLIVIVCLAAMTGTHAPGQEPGPSVMVDRVWTVLRQVETEGTSLPEVAQALHRLGADALPAMADVLAGDRPPTGSDAKGNALPPAPPLTEAQKVALASALRRHPVKRLEALVRSLVPGDADVGQRVRALQLIRDVGHGGLLEAVLEIASGIEPRVMFSPHVNASYRDALMAVLADPSALRRLEKGWKDVPESLTLPAVRAVADVGGLGALTFLTRRLGDDAKLNIFTLKQIDRIAPVLVRADRLALDRVRSRMREGTVRERQEVLRTLAELHDSESFLPILRNLGDAEPRIRRLALWSLQKMSGERFEADADRWWAWYEKERDWLGEEWPLLQHKLGSSRDADVLGALRAIGRRRLHRDDIIPDIQPLLLSRSPIIRETAAAVLRRLGSPHALPALVEALTDPEERVRKAVLEALREISNRDADPEPDAWRRVLGQA